MPKKAKLLIYWDYELQTGANQAISTKGKWNGFDDYNATKDLLKILKNHNIKSTFAIVGVCAKSNTLPYSSIKQIEQIAKDGHAIASHTMNHEYLPDLTIKQIIQTLKQSKQILEKITNKKVTSFVPPHNQPAYFHGLTLETKKKLALSKITLNKLSKILKKLGYKTYRNNYLTPFQTKILKIAKSHKPFYKNNIKFYNLNCSDGFGKDAKEVVKHAIKTKSTAVVIAHPWALNFPGNQSKEMFLKFIEFIKRLEEKGLLEITTTEKLV
jgi:peptidoglycan/xylan/chitin deacetylase (PgdA/CDA1 family)